MLSAAVIDALGLKTAFCMDTDLLSRNCMPYCFSFFEGCVLAAFCSLFGF